MALTAVLGQSADPHPERTEFLGPIVRMLDDPRVLDWLAPDPAARPKLEKAAAEREAARRRQDALDPAGRHAELARRAEQRQQAYAWQAAGELGEARMRRLAALAVRTWGEEAAFAPGIADKLGLTAAQREERRQRAARTEEPLRPDPPLLTAAQRQLLAGWLGAPPAFTPDLRIAEEERRAAARLIPVETPLRLDPWRSQQLLALAEVHAALKLPNEERRDLKAWAAAALAEEAKATAPQGGDDTLAARQARAVALDRRCAAEAAARLGTERARRFGELRRQCLGWGGAFGEADRAALGVAPETVHKAFADASAAVDRLHQAPGGFNPAAARVACDAALEKVLSAEQRSRWRTLCGEPFPNDVLQQTRRAAERP